MVQTRGPFAINPSPTKKRLRSGVGISRGSSKGTTGDRSTLAVSQSASSPSPGSDGTLGEHKRPAAAAAGAAAAAAVGSGAGAGAKPITAPIFTTPESSRRHRSTATEPDPSATLAGFVAAQQPTAETLGGREHGDSHPGKVRCGGGRGGTGRRLRGGRSAASASQQRSVKLLPGQNYQMELVFLPATASEDITEALQSSFCPGSEVGNAALSHPHRLSMRDCWGKVPGPSGCANLRRKRASHCSKVMVRSDDGTNVLPTTTQSFSKAFRGHDRTFGH